MGSLLTPALIRGWVGLPAMGVTSGAYAAVVSYLAALGWLAWYLRRQKKHPFRPDAAFAKHLNIDGALLIKILRVGLPTALFMITISIAEIVLMNLVLTGALVLLGYLFSRSILGLFITDAAVVEMAQTLLHIMLWSIIIMDMSMVLSGLMPASGTVLMPTAIAMLAICGIEVPVAWALSTHCGLNGIWAAYPVAFPSMLTMQTIYYRWVWRKKPIRRRQEQRP